ncbi:unnamed protein product [Allacma fusca]|uniref:Uncharacterized protein n=1 Tax=Allacma fusca TaxID=39272 RepID=A0A8J2L0R6_9HEXA|nr:unnamed protein product [Allacma fusca]
MIVLEPVNVAGWSCWAAPVTFGPKCRSNLAVLGKGFNSKAKAIWRGIGCGHKSMGATLTWGNVAAYPEIRCKGVPTGSVISTEMRGTAVEPVISTCAPNYL